MVNTERVDAGHGSDFHPLADGMTKLPRFHQGCVSIFTFHVFQLHKRDSMLQWILGRYVFY